MSIPVPTLGSMPCPNKIPMTENTKQTKRMLLEHRLAPTKALGQNFLIHQHTAQAIVAAGKIQAGEVVVEVGVGLGALTHPLAAAAHHVYGFEVDRGIVRMHLENNDLPKNVTLVHEDILSADFDDLSRRCGGKLIVLANLPYSITNPFLFKLIDNSHLIARATVMVQKEVADRLTAPPSTKEYGVPTILLGCRATVRQVLLLKPGEFHPRPKIDSVVLSLDFFSDFAPFCPPGFSHSDFLLLKKVVRAAFNQRRKTLVNSLSVHLAVDEQAILGKSSAKASLEKLLELQGLSSRVRPEDLSIKDFVVLTQALAKELYNGYANAT